MPALRVDEHEGGGDVSGIAVDLFCGAGGASRGLHDAGYDVIGFDHWQPAVDTHNANGMPAHLHDLSDASIDDLIPACDLMWASPPCQPFSAAGDGEGEFDGRDGFPWMLRIVAQRLPGVLIVENVKGLTFDKHRDYFGGILQALAALGYEWDWRVLNCADLGVPQTRERCIIVARRDGGRITWPMPTHTEQPGMFTEAWVTMAHALGWSGDLSYRRVEGMIERHGERGPWSIDEIPAPTVHANSAKDWLVTAGRDAHATVRSVDLPAPTILARNDPHGWTLHYRQTDGNGDPITCDVTDRPSPTVGTKSQGQWIMNDAIRLEIHELARLQGFPDDWVWTGTKTAQARQVGNAVPPALAHAVAANNRPVVVA